MTTRQHDSVDFVTLDRTGKVVSLVMVEDRPWGEMGALLPDLQSKLNTYLGFILDGHLEEQYPQARGAKRRVELRTKFPPGERELQFLSIVRRQHLEPAGIEFLWESIDAAN